MVTPDAQVNLDVLLDMLLVPVTKGDRTPLFAPHTVERFT